MTYSPAENWLITHDAVMARLISQNGPLAPYLRVSTDVDYFAALARSITGQQISVKAAQTIYGRFHELTQSLPEKTIELTAEQVKYIGFSGMKWRYIYDLALHFVDNPAIYDHLEKIDDTAVVTELTAVKGIGAWTAQMFLTFTLGRPDVFAPGDRGLQLAIQRLYNFPVTPPPKALEQLASTWSPYRTTACTHLWHSLENMPTNE